ncbi:hypothetical protein FPZ43_03335 [Mucilaginibacter pallidiroseus]|uniref:Uncharacterized protein n=1 Tax=Mucilaginibacter pallidiroseus TaxID=2599295 RepID=A0A563UJN4_9SPHI|nr:polysaccharide biosynthesis/export family protein [Mucilaginibacter pallidiroseus]TWR31519.1 hypothetical protein FPZ43_03335 [Mucilaginibacter pallidiroseus]
MCKLLLLGFIAIVTFLTSCSTQQNQLLFQQKTAKVDTVGTANSDIPLSSYRIKPQDMLQIRNLQSLKYIVDEVPGSASGTGSAGGAGSANNGQTYQVEQDGTVTLPVIGHVKVANLTRIEATKVIEDLYRKSLLKDPIIDLKVVNLKVTVLGDIASQGNFMLEKDNVTLVEIIGQAGGLMPTANEKNVKIIRGGRVKTVTTIDLSDINSLSDPKAILQSGDIIYIAKNKRAVRNENLQNFSLIAQPALLLINTALLIFNLAK